MYDFQKEAIRAILANRKVIINKARQLGFSTLLGAFVVWLIMFHNDKEVLIIANKQGVAKNLLAKIKLVLAHLPEWMYLTDQKENSVHTISFTNGSSVKSVARSDDAGRSEAVSLLILDEAAHIDRMDELGKGAASTTATGGKVVALSSPYGIGNWFHEYFTKAESGEIDWFPFTTHWWENPDYAVGITEDPMVPGGKTSPWFKNMTEGWSRQQIAQELLTSFIESGDTFFRVESIEHLDKIKLDPIRQEGVDRNLWIWKDPTPGFRYLISADVAQGTGEDYSSFHVLELKDLEAVAEYKGKIPPDMFGDFLVSVGERYNNAFIVPESQGIGMSTCLHIKTLGYRNLCYFSKETGRLIDQWSAEYHGIMPGQPMSVKERPMILAKVEEFLRKGLVKIYSKRFINEMNTFVIKNGKPQAEKGTNDDLIMSLAIAVWVRDMCPEFRGQLASADAVAAISAITKQNNTYAASNSIEFRLEQHKRRIEKLIHQQKVPLNQGAMGPSWLYKI